MENNSLNLRNKSIEEKLDIIDEIEDANFITENSLEILGYLSLDQNEELRSRVAEVLVLSNSPKAEKILINLLNDEDEIVRVNACDSLGISDSLEVLELLKERTLRDKSSMVRGYAALSIADVATRINYNLKDLANFLINILKKERVTWVKISYYNALYVLGEKNYLKLLINELNNRLYRNRCSVVNSLYNIISYENSEQIKSALVKRMKVEKTIAVKSTIEKVLQEI